MKYGDCGYWRQPEGKKTEHVPITNGRGDKHGIGQIVERLAARVGGFMDLLALFLGGFFIAFVVMMIWFGAEILNFYRKEGENDIGD